MQTAVLRAAQDQTAVLSTGAAQLNKRRSVLDFSLVFTMRETFSVSLVRLSRDVLFHMAFFELF